MAVFTCKRCGGTLEIKEGERIAKCLYCGTLQTLPNLDDEKRENLYNRASHFRRNNEYDKAMSIYEKILEEDPTDAEAYWSIILCRFGVEYVEDPKTHERIPTINRMQKASILADEDYKQVLKLASAEQRDVYIHDAEEIAKIQKGILEISSKEEPFDVFICYKETDSRGMRTIDSVLAQDLYKELTKEGMKVFFSRITLEDKLGVAYEPYIFAALNSAKVMVAVGTSRDNFNAVWVKNEWSRYLALVNAGENKTLIPAYKDMDPYDLPDELLPLQAQDMSKIGFMQDLVRGVKKIVGVDNKRNKSAVMTGSVDTIFKRGQVLLSEGNFEDADKCAERILDIDFQNARAYLLKLLAEYKVKDIKELETLTEDVGKSQNFEKAYKYADEALRAELDDLKDKLHNAYVHEQQLKYKDAEDELKKDNLDAALDIFRALGDFEDAKKRRFEIESEITYRKLTTMVDEATTKETLGTCLSVASGITDYKDVRDIVAKIEKKIHAIETKGKKIKWAVIGSAIAVFVIVLMSYIGGVFIAPIVRAGNVNALLEEGNIFKATQLCKQYHMDSEANTLGALYKYRTGGIYGSIFELFACQGTNVTIKYQLDDEMTDKEYLFKDSVDNVAEYTYSMNSDLPEPSKKYYDFICWNVDECTAEYTRPGFQIHMTVSAEYEPKSFDITYDFAGGVSNNNPEYYEVTEDTPIGYPVRIGHTFLGWTGTDIAEITHDVTIPKYSLGNKEYTAHWELNKYKITLDKGNGTEVIEVFFGQNVTLPELPSNKVGYEFAGWYNGDIKVESGEWVYAQNMTLTAKWQPRTYDITYKDTDIQMINVQYLTWMGYHSPDSESVNKTYYYGDVIENMMLPPRGNSYFLGWYLDSDYTQPFEAHTEYTEDMMLHSKWANADGITNYNWCVQIDEHYRGEDRYFCYIPRVSGSVTITCDLEDEEISLYRVYDLVGSSEYIKDFKGSYTFNAEKGNMYVLYIATGATKNIDIAHGVSTHIAKVGAIGDPAKYAPGTDSVCHVRYDSDYTLMTPVREGYTLAGWYNGSEPFASTGKWTYENITLTPKWTANTYNITFDTNGGNALGKQTVTYDSAYTLPVPTIGDDTLEFAGWYNGDTVVKDGTWAIPHDVTLVVKWQTKRSTVTMENIDRASITVNYVGNSGYNTTTTTKKYKAGDKIEYLRLDSVFGGYDSQYVVTGWYLDSGCNTRFDFDVPVSEDITLYAKWENFSCVEKLVELMDDKEISTTANWFIYHALSDGDITITTQDYTIIEVLGSSGNKVVSNEGTSVTCRVSKFNSYMIRVGNKDDQKSVKLTCNNKFTNNAVVTVPEGRDYVYAQGATCTYDLLMGEPYTLPTPYRMGYAFAGWYEDGTRLDMTGTWTRSDEFNLVAHWTANDYKYTLDNNDGTGTTPTSHDVTFDESFSLPTPTRLGYEFLGWYDGATKVESGKWNIDHDVALVAKWKAKEYTLMYKDIHVDTIEVKYLVRYEGTSSSDQFRTYRENDVIEHLVLDDIDQYAATKAYFAGWVEEKTNKRLENIATVSEDIVLQSYWTYLPRCSFIYNSSKRYGDSSVKNARYYLYIPLYTQKVQVKTTVPHADVYRYDSFTFVDEMRFDEANEKYTKLGTSTPTKPFEVTLEGGKMYFVDTMSISNDVIDIVIDDSTNQSKTYVRQENGIKYNQGTNESYKLKYGEEYTLLTPARPGYTFDGWTDSSTGDIMPESGTWNYDKGIVLTANWTPSTYHVTFDNNGAESNLESDRDIVYGTQPDIKTPNRTGYDFAGWYDGDKRIEYPNPSGWSIDHDVHLVAHWTAHQHDVTFKDTNIKTVTVTYNVPHTFARVLTYRVGEKIEYIDMNKGLENSDDYYNEQAIFAGWYREPECLNRFDFDTPVTQDLQLYGKYIKPFTRYATYVPMDTKTTSDNYYFVFVPAVNTTITLTYSATRNSAYAVTEQSDEVYENRRELCSSRVEPFTFNAKAGCIYVVIAPDHQENTLQIESTTKFVNNTVVSLAPGEKECTYSSGSNKVLNMTYGDTFNMYKPERAGYTFDGWYIDQNGDGTYDAGDTLLVDAAHLENFVWDVDSPVMLVANWIGKSYKVQFDTSGGNAETGITVTMGTTPKLPVPTINNDTLEFAGWYYGDTKVDNAPWNIAGNVTLKAKWQTKRSTVTLEDTGSYNIKVRYHHNHPNDNAVDEKIYYAGDAIENIKIDDININKNGEDKYIFTYWSLDSNGNTPYNFDGAVSEDMDLYAHWTTYKCAPQLVRLRDGDTLTHTTYYFFYVADVDGTATVTISRNYRITIQDVNNHAQTYGEGSVEFSVTKNRVYVIYISNDIISKSISLTVNNKFVNNTVVTAPSGKEYVHSLGDSSTCDLIMNEPYTLPTPYRKGYIFEGWYEGMTPIALSGVWHRGDDFNLTPHWTAGSYQYTLDNNDGTGAEPDVYNATFGESFSLPTPTYKGHTFLGWYDGATKVESGKWTFDYNLSLVAKWQAKEYTLMYKNAVADTITVTYDDVKTYKGTSKRTEQVRIGDKIPYRVSANRKIDDEVEMNYYFAGWFLDKEYNHRFDFSERVDHDITLYAKWIPVPRNVAQFNYAKYYNVEAYGNTSVYVPERDDHIIMSLSDQYKTSSLNLTIYKVNGINPSNQYEVLTTEMGKLHGEKTLALDVKAGELYFIYSGTDVFGQFVDIIDNNPSDNNTSIAVSDGIKGANYANDDQKNISFRIQYGETYELIPAHRPGYTFGGWTDNSTGDIVPQTGTWNYDKGIVLNAKWTANTYHVTFDNNGAESNLESDRDIVYDSHPDIKTPNRKGYDFAGWYEGDERIAYPNPLAYDQHWPVDHDAHLVAHWTPHQHDVTFKDTNIKTVTVTYNAPYFFAMPKVKTYSVGDKIEYLNLNENHVFSNIGDKLFVGWYREMECINRFDFDEPITENIELYAKTQLIKDRYNIIDEDITCRSYPTDQIYVARVSSRVTVRLEGKSNYIRVYFGEGDVYYGANPIATGHGEVSFNAEQGQFYHIVAPNDQESIVTMTSSNPFVNNAIVSLAPGEKACEYASGSDKVIKMTYDDTFNMYKPERAGYTFDGWYIDNGNGTYDVEDELLVDAAHLENFTWKIDAPVTLVAKWAPIT